MADQETDALEDFGEIPEPRYRPRRLVAAKVVDDPSDPGDESGAVRSVFAVWEDGPDKPPTLMDLATFDVRYDREPPRPRLVVVAEDMDEQTADLLHEAFSRAGLGGAKPAAILAGGNLLAGFVDEAQVEAAARARRAAMATPADAGVAVSPTGPMDADELLVAFDAWLRATGKSDNTRECYCRDARPIGHPAKSVGADEIAAHLQRLRDDGKSLATVRRALSAIRVYYDFLVSIGYARVNVARLVATPAGAADLTVESLDSCVQGLAAAAEAPAATGEEDDSG